jgi:hypothetical protein
MGPHFHNVVVVCVAIDGLSRYCFEASAEAKVCDAVFDAMGTVLGIAIFLTREPQNLQSGAQIAEHYVASSSQIGTALLSLKLQKQKRFRKNRDRRHAVRSRY